MKMSTRVMRIEEKMSIKGSFSFGSVLPNAGKWIIHQSKTELSKNFSSNWLVLLTDYNNLTNRKYSKTLWSGWKVPKLVFKANFLCQKSSESFWFFLMKNKGLSCDKLEYIHMAPLCRIHFRNKFSGEIKKFQI